MTTVAAALLAPSDVPDVADLHRRAFPDYDSTQLGPRYCRRMLRAYAAHPEAWVAVARSAGAPRPVGYLVAAPPAVQRSINRSLRPWAAVAGLRSPMRLLSRLRPSTPPSSAAPATDPAAATAPVPATIRVVLIGVDPAARGTGVGRVLLDDFASRARAAGHAVADLSVAVGNEAARRAYAAAGWAEVGEEGGVAVRCRLDLVPEGPTS